MSRAPWDPLTESMDSKRNTCVVYYTCIKRYAYSAFSMSPIHDAAGALPSLSLSPLYDPRQEAESWNGLVPETPSDMLLVLRILENM